MIDLNISEGSLLSLFYSTSPAINQINSDYLRIPVFQSSELDDNRDGITDRIEINLQMPLSPFENIYGFSALIYCNTKLQSKVKYIFDAVSYATFESMSPISKVTIDGDLLFRQTWPLSAKGG